MLCWTPLPASVVLGAPIQTSSAYILPCPTPSSGAMYVHGRMLGSWRSLSDKIMKMRYLLLDLPNYIARVEESHSRPSLNVSLPQ